MTEPRPLDSRTLFRVGVAFELSLIGVASILARLHTGSWFPFRVSFDWMTAAWIAGATAPLLGMALFFLSPPGLRVRPLRRIYEVMHDHLGTAVLRLSFVEIAILSLSAGFGEEFLFRGVIQREWGGVGTASLIFALLHALTPAYFVIAFGISVYFGWLYIATDENLLVPAIAHSAYDIVALALFRSKLRRANAIDGAGDSSEERTPAETGDD